MRGAVPLLRGCVGHACTHSALELSAVIFCSIDDFQHSPIHVTLLTYTYMTSLAVVTVAYPAQTSACCHWLVKLKRTYWCTANSLMFPDLTCSGLAGYASPTLALCLPYLRIMAALSKVLSVINSTLRIIHSVLPHIKYHVDSHIADLRSNVGVPSSTCRIS